MGPAGKGQWIKKGRIINKILTGLPSLFELADKIWRITEINIWVCGQS